VRVTSQKVHVSRTSKRNAAMGGHVTSTGMPFRFDRWVWIDAG